MIKFCIWTTDHSVYKLLLLFIKHLTIPLLESVNTINRIPSLLKLRTYSHKHHQAAWHRANHQLTTDKLPLYIPCSHNYKHCFQYTAVTWIWIFWSFNFIQIPLMEVFVRDISQTGTSQFLKWPFYFFRGTNYPGIVRNNSSEFNDHLYITCHTWVMIYRCMSGS